MAKKIVVVLLWFTLCNFFSWHSACAQSIPQIIAISTSSLMAWNTSIGILSSSDGSLYRVILARLGSSSAFYSCGFLCISPCVSFFFVVVITGSIANLNRPGLFPGLIWTANRDNAVAENATLQLNHDGLVLRDSNGANVWSTNITSGGSVSGVNITEAGNLDLFTDKDEIVWEAFDHPTDTLVLDHKLNEGQNVTSSASATKWSRSLFYVSVNSNGLSAGTTSKSSALMRMLTMAPETTNGSRTSDSPPVVFNIIAACSSLAGVAFPIITVVCIMFFCKKKDPEEELEYQFNQLPGFTVRFLYEDLLVATDNFNQKLGGGGFGSVFKGILRDGTGVAVKRMDNQGQGMKEFLAEIETIGSIHHFNVVKLIGFCAEKSFRLLIYEYMSNGSLDSWIFNSYHRPPLDWQTRKKIIIDIAKGLAYLHEDCRQRIAHLDIKPQNILLDDHFNAKISDFGLSKLIDRDESQVFTTVRGTPGYLAPEWQRSKITVKADVYSFGIVVLEIVCGRKNLDYSQPESNVHLLSLLQKMAEENRLVEMVGKQSEDMESNEEEALKVIKIAAWCLQHDHSMRPLMSTVVKVLEGVVELEADINFRFLIAVPPSTPNVSPPLLPSVVSAPR